MRRITLICLGVLMAAHPVMAMTPQAYMRVMDAVNSRNLKSLQQLRAAGIDMNSPQPNGMTPLCETIRQGDYEGYEMLLTQGASPYVYCVRQLPEREVAEFYAHQPPAHTYYTGRLGTARAVSEWGTTGTKTFDFPFLGVGEVLLGGVAAAGILTLGHGGSSGDEDNKYVWTAPLSLEKSDFETNEYQAATVGSDSIDFLGDVNASSAYARGYTGYKVKRKKDGTLDGEGEAAIDKTQKVRVAVVDTGVWPRHPDLKNNIGSQYNFVYGECSETNNKKCWAATPISDTMVSMHLYENWGTSTQKDLGSITMSMRNYLAYATKYYGYTYSANDAAPWIHKIWKSGNTEYVVYRKDSKLYIYDPDHVNPTAGSLGTWELTCTDDECSYTVGETNYKVTELTDFDNHGTHVAGIVGATKNDEGMMGVAYNATIIPVKVDLDIGGLEGLSTAADKADIVNVSIMVGSQLTGGRNYATKSAAAAAFESALNNQPTSGLLDGYRAAAAGNKILVFAAGNYVGSDSGAIPPYDPQPLSLALLSDLFNGKKKHEDGKTYNLTNLLVNVVSVNRDGDNYSLAAYSPKCGVTKNYCIAAPGGVSYTGDMIYSTVRTAEGTESSDYGYEGLVGTSQAAPIVSGALAVIKGAFPHLTNQQVVQILFETATDLGEKGVDEIYGHGLVNLDAATDPIGLTKIPLSGKASGASVSASNSSTTVPTSLSGVAKVLPAKMVVLDKYDRAFPMATSSFVHVAKRENKLDGRFKSFMRGDEKVVATNDNFTMAYSERRSNLNGKGMQHGSVSFEFKPTAKWSFKSYYTENTETSGGTYFERLMQSPYAKMKEAWGGAVSYDLSKNWKATVTGQVGQNGFVNEDDLNDMERNKVSLLQSTLQYNGLKKVGFKVTAGMTNEQGSTLGMWGRGAFKSGNSKTAFVGAGVTLNLTDALTIEGMYYSGKTQVSNSRSLVQMSNLKSDSFAVTAAWKANENRIFGLQFVSPLRVRRGTATVDLPVARDAYQDIMYRESVKADLKPSAREYDIGLYYSDALQEDVHLQSEFGVRLNPDHVAGAAPDWRALIGLHFGL